MEEMFPRLFPDKNLKIVREFEDRIERLRGKHGAQEKKNEMEKVRILSALKRRALSINKLIEKYDKPLNVIFISYSTQKDRGRGGRIQEAHFIKGELEKYHAKYLGGTDSVIPPAYVPTWIKDGKDLKRWFSRNILRGRYCKLKLLALVDIKRKAYWDTLLPYKQTHPIHKNIGEVLNVKDLFTEQQIRRIALGEIIVNGDIAWLASTILVGDELEVILNNQSLIEKELGNPSLRNLATDSGKNDLSRVLSKFIQHPSNVADKIIAEAKFWQEKLKD